MSCIVMSCSWSFSLLCLPLLVFWRYCFFSLLPSSSCSSSSLTTSFTLFPPVPSPLWLDPYFSVCFCFFPCRILTWFSHARNEHSPVCLVRVLSYLHLPGERYLYHNNLLDLCILSSSSDAERDLLTTVVIWALSTLRDPQPFTVISHLCLPSRETLIFSDFFFQKYFCFVFYRPLCGLPVLPLSLKKRICVLHYCHPVLLPCVLIKDSVC